MKSKRELIKFRLVDGGRQLTHMIPKVGLPSLRVYREAYPGLNNISHTHES